MFKNFRTVSIIVHFRNDKLWYRIAFRRDNLTRIYERQAQNYALQELEFLIQDRPLHTTHFGINVCRITFDFTKG